VGGFSQTQLCKQTPHTIDLGNRRLGVQQGDSLHEGLWKPFLEGEAFVKA
jgi:hypothetical protein